MSSILLIYIISNIAALFLWFQILNQFLNQDNSCSNHPQYNRHADRQTDRHHHCLNLPVVWGLKNKQNWHRLRGDTHFTVIVDNDDHTCSALRSHHPGDLEKTQCQPIMDSPWSITWLWTERNSEVNGRQRVQWARSSVMRCQVSDLLQPPQLRLTPEAHHQPASADTAAIRSAILTTRSPFIRLYDFPAAPIQQKSYCVINNVARYIHGPPTGNVGIN